MMKHWRLSAQDWEQGKDCPLLAFLFDIVMEAIAMAIGKDNVKRKGIQIAKEEIHLFQFSWQDHHVGSNEAL